MTVVVFVGVVVVRCGVGVTVGRVVCVPVWVIVVVIGVVVTGQHRATGQQLSVSTMYRAYPSGHEASPRSEHFDLLQTQEYEQQHSEIC